MKKLINTLKAKKCMRVMTPVDLQATGNAPCRRVGGGYC